MNKPILCLDFDGVIHSYTTPWQEASIIPDPPVPGALEFIVKALRSFDVCIFSSRSHKLGGKRAMKRYLIQHFENLARTYETTPEWLRVEIRAFADPWELQVEYDVRRLVRAIRWPYFKPPAKISIDDRALTFTGTFPEIKMLQEFKPWNKT